MSELYCTYCGSPKGDRIQCCQENHWMTAKEYIDYHGEHPDDGFDDDQLNTTGANHGSSND